MHRHLRLVLSLIPALAAATYVGVGLTWPRAVVERPGPGQPAPYIPDAGDRRIYVEVADPAALTPAENLRVYFMEYLTVLVTVGALGLYLVLVIRDRREAYRQEFARLEAEARDEPPGEAADEADSDPAVRG